MKTFEQWYNKINEEIAAPAVTDSSTSVVAEPTTDVRTDRDAMISDVDAIMTSLETLASELKEELNTEELNEADGDAFKKVIDFTVRAPKARMAQSKVNKMKLKIAALHATAAQASGETATKLKTKADAMKAQATELQSMVDDKYSGSGSIVAKALSSEKIKGQLAVLKAGMGEGGDNDAAQKQALKLKKRLQDEEAALAQLKPKQAEKPATQTPAATTAQESLVSRAVNVNLNELAEEIASKESWQLIEGTALYVKYENQIRKTELSNSLNESHSIKDKFSKLI